jgi:hypothetical protein
MSDFPTKYADSTRQKGKKLRAGKKITARGAGEPDEQARECGSPMDPELAEVRSTLWVPGIQADGLKHSTITNGLNQDKQKGEELTRPNVTSHFKLEGHLDVRSSRERGQL